ncbi:hypothetical protein [Sporosarcina sp.]|uniref:hypothetical protein n=1 Tax=Sporosarcina sp. TaxID=49982 RepID=UPI002635DA99|nr:hypothetical protein [Sporosarcina sp.]
MKKNVFTLVIVFILALFVFNPSPSKANEINEMPKYYDELDREIKPYTQEEYLEKTKLVFERFLASESVSSNNMLSNLYPKYFEDFGSASFSNFVWVRSGKTYKNPLYISIERLNRTTGLAIYVYDSANTYQGKAVFPKYGSIWHSLDVDYLPRGKSYKFKLVSESGELAKVSKGEIGYNN